MEIYTLQKPKEATFWQKIFRRKVKENAMVEINNLLAEKNLEEIEEAEIAKIVREYKLNWQKDFTKEREALWKMYLLFCLERKAWKEEGMERLGALLALTKERQKSLFLAEGREKYKDSIQELIVREESLEEHEEELKELREVFEISEEEEDAFLKENISKALELKLKEALIDERFSPEEEAELKAMAKRYHANLDYEENTKRIMARYRKYWELEFGELEALEPDIHLQKQEELYFTTAVSWYEQRSRTRRVNYSGPTARFRIAKGIYWRMGSMDVERITEDVWKAIDVGRIFFTNKRIIFMGERGNKNIRLNRILDFRAFKNGMSIEKDSGKSPFIEFSQDVDIAALTLLRLLKES